MFVPPIARKKLAGQSPSLAAIAQWFRAPNWTGLYSLYPFHNLETTDYNLHLPPDCQEVPMHASVLEAHRRALELERACQDLTDYLCQSFAKTDCLHAFSEQHVRNARAALAAGGGLFGSGKDFWASPPPGLSTGLARISQRLDKASSGESSLADDAKWLREHRKSAFHRAYTVVDELTWGMPLLTLCFRHQADLAHLDEEDKAQAMLKAFQNEQHERARLYAADLQPLLRYGGRLTRYVTSLYALAGEHYSTLNRIPGSKHRLSFPRHCKPLRLDKDGHLVGAGGQLVVGGHVALPEPTLSEGDARPPLPFPEACCVDVDAPAVDCKARLDKEEIRLQDMLKIMLGSPDDCSVVTAMRKAQGAITRRLRDDSHQARLTAPLPPTPSMPSAAYAPEQFLE